MYKTGTESGGGGQMGSEVSANKSLSGLVWKPDGEFEGPDGGSVFVAASFKDSIRGRAACGCILSRKSGFHINIKQR